MKRRELIRIITLSTGSAMVIPLSGSLLTACKKVKKISESAYIPKFFSEQEFSFLKKLLNLLLPETNSPSATDVGVHQIMDTIIATVYSPDRQKDFKTMFLAFSDYTNSKELVPATIRQLLKTETEGEQVARAGLLDIKQQAVAYYLNTEEIAKNYLNYLPNPGDYEPCISLESVNGKAWAT